MPLLHNYMLNLKLGIDKGFIILSYYFCNKSNFMKNQQWIPFLPIFSITKDITVFIR